MLQIVHDVAPKAKLAFRTGFVSEGDFALGVRQLADVANCDIIVDDITYITEPFFRDGFVAQSANYVHDHNKTISQQQATSPGNPIQPTSVQWPHPMV
jgi:hypothetical protein